MKNVAWNKRPDGRLSGRYLLPETLGLALVLALALALALVGSL